MQIKKRERQRLVKSDNMKLVLSKTTELHKSVCSLISKQEFEKYSYDYLRHQKVIAIYEGETKVLIIYGGWNESEPNRFWQVENYK